GLVVYELGTVVPSCLYFHTCVPCLLLRNGSLMAEGGYLLPLSCDGCSEWGGGLEMQPEDPRAGWEVLCSTSNGKCRVLRSQSCDSLGRLQAPLAAAGEAARRLGSLPASLTHQPVGCGTGTSPAQGAGCAVRG
uniref:Uncharacterized protein n=1 Tax=Dromaius novaehollandiae TaxID=8790 RepID=A0A8C4KQ61_DRONO